MFFVNRGLIVITVSGSDTWTTGIVDVDAWRGGQRAWALYASSSTVPSRYGGGGDALRRSRVELLRCHQIDVTKGKR